MAKVEDVMRLRVPTVDDNESLADVAKCMSDENCGFVPVVDKDTRRLCGVLTDRDVWVAALAAGIPLDHVPVAAFMSRTVAVCGPNDNLFAVETIMRESHVRHVPVVNELQDVVGVVSLDDIARAALESDDVGPRDSVARTLALLSQPNPVQTHQQIRPSRSPPVDDPVPPSRAAKRHMARISALVGRAQQGSKTIAFTELWEAHAAMLHAILLSMVPSQEVEDLLQDVALRAWKAIGDLQNPDRFSPWLCTIARNVGRNALVSRSNSAETAIDDAIGDGLVASGDAPDAASDAEGILQHIRQLPLPYREPMALRLLLDLSGPEIAERTGLIPGSVRVNLCRGLKLLRERLIATGVGP